MSKTVYQEGNLKVTIVQSGDADKGEWPQSDILKIESGADVIYLETADAQTYISWINRSTAEEFKEANKEPISEGGN